MKNSLRFAGFIGSFLLCISAALAQSAPPSLPAGHLLDLWQFSDTNYLSLLRRTAPLATSNAVFVSTWAGTGLQMDSTNAAWLNYPVVDAGGYTNLALAQGTFETWYSPAFNSGDDLGHWATLLEAGAWNTNLTAATGAWGLFISPDSSGLFFSAQTNGMATNYLNTPIAWSAGDWHHLLITYSATNSALYLEGQLVTNGPGITVLPAPSVLSNGFSIGSDGNGTGLLQAHGVFNNLITYDYELSPDAIAANYAFDSQNVYPLPSTGGRFHANSAPSLPGSDDSGTNGGGTLAGFQSPAYGANDFYLQALALGANSYNTNTNAITILLHGTVADTAYQLFSTTNLNPPVVWTLEQNLIGSAITNFTPATVALASRPTLYFKALAATLDSDADGLPDWWELKYFGHLGVDPYGDPDGDGWNNLQEYQNGTNPNQANMPPPPPKNVTAHLAGTYTNIVFTWQPGGGVIDHYGIEEFPLSSGNEIGTVGSNTFTFSGVSAYPILSLGNITSGLISNEKFVIRAYLTNGTYVDSSPISPYGADVTGAVAGTRGPSGDLYLAISASPPDFSGIAVTWDYDPGNGSFLVATVMINPSDLTNGILRLPVEKMTNYFLGSPVFCQILHSNAAPSYPDHVGFPIESWDTQPVFRFVDQRPHMKENLRFLLGGATLTMPFIYQFNFVVAPYGDADLDQEASPTNYAYYGYRVYRPGQGFSVMEELRPIQEHFLFRDFLFDANELTNGNFSTGMGDVVDYDPIVRGFNSFPKYFYTGDFTETPLPMAFTLTNASSIFFDSFSAHENLDFGYFDSDSAGEIGIIADSNTNLFLSTGAKNCYGLPLTALVLGTNQFALPANVLDPSYEGAYFANVSVPTLGIRDYYFAVQNPIYQGDYITPHFRPTQPLPGAPDFNPTNASPLLIAAIGQQIAVSGWARMNITNGYTGTYAFLEQYFDKAYKINTNGTVTTNQTGILSPYGEFFATEPGQTALITMPDIDTAQRGTGVVNVVSLQVDKSRDGIMDLTLAGPDHTSANRPFVFWANNDYDRLEYDADDNTNYEDSVLVAGCPYTPNQDTRDNNYRDTSGRRVIPTKRDLQDFTRLWLAGITTNLLTNLPSGSTIMLSWGDVGSPNTNNPTIDLFAAAEANGGIGYLTNETVASQQTNIALCPYIGRLGPGSSIQLNASTFSNHWAGNCLIWCGAAYGSGALTLTIADASSNVLAQTVAYIQIVDIKQMYERWTVGDAPGVAPTNTARLAEDNFPPGLSPIPFQYGTPTDTNTPYILYVHGWNMSPNDKDRFAETAFKRLYWQGYQGRFGVFRWPTGYGFAGISSLATNINEKDNYDSSEFNAWQSGNGLLNKLEDLNAQYPGHVYLLAHSMGNVVAGEALRLSSGRVVNTYVASQGAISAHTYDTNVPDYSFYFPPLSYSADTPNIYGNWFAGNNGGGAGTIINFDNTNDYALARTRWGLNQLLKPDHNVLEITNTWTYGYTGSTNDGQPWNNFIKTTSGGGFVAFFITTSVAARYEVMAYAAQSWTTALGATPGTLASINRNLDLTRTSPNSIWPSPDPFGNNYANHFWHSAEFRGDNALQGNYWNELLGVEAFNLK